MKIMIGRRVTTLMGAIALLAASPAHAGFEWEFDGSTAPLGSGCQYATPNSVGNQCVTDSTFNGDTITVTATGWASSTTSISSGLQKATLNVWDGLAVQAQGEYFGSSPEHATDNSGKLESILFDFGNDVPLSVNSVTMGWHQDADFSLLAYTGANGSMANPGDLAGKSYTDLLSSGWELVSNSLYGGSASADTDISSPDDSYYYSTTDENGNPMAFNDGFSSSYWLVAALNDAYWNNPQYVGNDYFKLKFISGDEATPPDHQPGVPEPATLMLMGIGMVAMRRKLLTRD
jgi:hypothetical protein